jgi:hypothetical protein
VEVAPVPCVATAEAAFEVDISFRQPHSEARGIVVSVSDHIRCGRAVCVDVRSNHHAGVRAWREGVC